jgi:hypothetical protein
MRLRARSWPGILAAALAAATLVPATAVAAPSVSAAAAQSAAPAASQRLLLINGVQLASTRSPSGRPTWAVLPPLTGGLLRVRTSGLDADIPVDALPYLGRGLDPALFSLSALQRVESGGRLPVSVSFTGAVRALPGIRYTKTAQGQADGYLTASSARAFGAALARQFRADHRTGRYGDAGLLAGVTISLPGTRARPKAQPRFPMHTLTMTGTNLRGQPDTGDLVYVMNVGDPSAFGGGELFETEAGNVFFHGSARYSLPDGTYWALGLFLQGNNQHEVVLPQFTVRGNTTVHVAERSATSRLILNVPRPAGSAVWNLSLVRGGPHVASYDIGDLGPGGFWVNPTQTRPALGSLQWYTYATRLSPSKAPGPPYAYNLNYIAPAGLIPSLRYTARPASLATVTERYYQSARSTGLWFSEGGTPAEVTAQGGGFFFDVPLPGLQTQYMTTGRGSIWGSNYFQYVSCYCGGQGDPSRLLRPGQRLTENWDNYPLTPQPDVNLLTGASAAGFPVLSSAVRQGHTLRLAPNSFSDNQFGHFGYGLYGGVGKVTGSYAVTQNGVTLARGNPVQGIPSVSLSRRPARIGFTLSSAWNAPQYAVSTGSTTTWSWRSAPQPHAVVPPGWYCDKARGGALVRSCAVQPLLTLRYQIRGLRLDETAPPGPQQIGLTVGHVQLAQAASISHVTAQVSFRNGASWQPVTVTPSGPGQYRLHFDAPAGAAVSLRVSAADQAGSSVSQTITGAYRTAATTTLSGSSPAAAPALRAACPPTRPGQLRCLALYRPQAAVNQAIAAGQHGPAARPRGLTPQQLEAAYRLPVGRKTGQTVAVSIAWNTPHLAAYLARYRQYFGLPPCPTSSGCLRIVNQRGQAGPLPASGLHSGWDLEATLDVSMISAACPHCKILVVEGNNDGAANLAATERTAARLGAQVISNSYGQRENGAVLPYWPAYHQRGHTIVAAAGDYGFTAAAFPADLTSVTAVGGTQLTPAPRTSRGWTERVWNTGQGEAGGSGCSAYVRKPSWQHDRHCAGRTVADVSAVAANVPIYNQAWGGWITVGGTSVATPLIAGIYGLAGNATAIPLGYAYSHRRDLFDVTRGNNAVVGSPARACGDDYLCVARRGYDAPTGLGTPDGLGAF